MRRILFALPAGRLVAVDGGDIEHILETFRMIFHENFLNMSQQMEYEAVSVCMPSSIADDMPLFEARNLLMKWKPGKESVKEKLQSTRLTRPYAHLVARHLAYLALLAITCNNPQLGLINSLDVVILTHSVSTDVQQKFWSLFSRDLQSFLSQLPLNRFNCTLTVWNLAFTADKHPKIVPLTKTEVPSMYLPTHGIHCSYKMIQIPDSVQHKGHYVVYLIKNMEAMGMISRLYIDPGSSSIFATANVENFIKKTDGKLVLTYSKNFAPTALLEYSIFFSCAFSGMDGVPAPILFSSPGMFNDEEVFVIMMGNDKASRRLLFGRHDPLPPLLQDESSLTVRALKAKIISYNIAQNELATLCTMLQSLCTLSLKNEQDRFATSVLFREVEKLSHRYSVMSDRHAQLFDFVKRINTQHNININYNSAPKRIGQRPYTERRYRPYLEAMSTVPQGPAQSQLRLAETRTIEGRQPDFVNPQFVPSNKQLGTGVNMVEF